MAQCLQAAGAPPGSPRKSAPVVQDLQALSILLGSARGLGLGWAGLGLAWVWLAFLRLSYDFGVLSIGYELISLGFRLGLIWIRLGFRTFANFY